MQDRLLASPWVYFSEVTVGMWGHESLAWGHGNDKAIIIVLPDVVLEHETRLYSESSATENLNIDR